MSQGHPDSTLELPQFRSLALDEIPQPDFADVQIVSVPSGASSNPRFWAEQIFDVHRMPAWVTGLMAVRQAVVGLVGIPQGDESAFTVDCVVGEEALINTDDRHLQFCCGVAIDSERSLLRVTTVVRLKGWRGRLYFAPVSLAHGPVVRSMVKAAVRRSA